MTGIAEAALGVLSAEGAGTVCACAEKESAVITAIAHTGGRCKNLGRVRFKKSTSMDTNGLLLALLACAQILGETGVGVGGCGQITG